MKGWVKIHRKLREWEWYTDVPVKALFIDLLISANHKDGKWQGVDVKKGEVITGIYSLSSSTGLSIQQIKTALKKLKKTQEIEIRATNKFSVIKLLKWEQYQIVEEDSNKLATNNQQASNKQSTTNKNDKKEKNVKKVLSEKSDDPFSLFWEAYPVKEKKKQSKEIWKRKKIDSKLPEILAFIEKAKETKRWQEGYIKQPTTFLNSEAWEDDLGAYGDRQAAQPVVRRSREEEERILATHEARKKDPPSSFAKQLNLKANRV